MSKPVNNRILKWMTNEAASSGLEEEPRKNRGLKSPEEIDRARRKLVDLHCHSAQLNLDEILEANEKDNLVEASFEKTVHENFDCILNEKSNLPLDARVSTAAEFIARDLKDDSRRLKSRMLVNFCFDKIKDLLSEDQNERKELMLAKFILALSDFDARPLIEVMTNGDEEIRSTFNLIVKKNDLLKLNDVRSLIEKYTSAIDVDPSDSEFSDAPYLFVDSLADVTGSVDESGVYSAEFYQAEFRAVKSLTATYMENFKELSSQLLSLLEKEDDDGDTVLIFDLDQDLIQQIDKELRANLRNLNIVLGLLISYCDQVETIKPEQWQEIFHILSYDHEDLEFLSLFYADCHDLDMPTTIQQDLFTRLVRDLLPASIENNEFSLSKNEAEDLLESYLISVPKDSSIKESNINAAFATMHELNSDKAQSLALEFLKDIVEDPSSEYDPILGDLIRHIQYGKKTLNKELKKIIFHELENSSRSFCMKALFKLAQDNINYSSRDRELSLEEGLAKVYIPLRSILTNDKCDFSKMLDKVDRAEQGDSQWFNNMELICYQFDFSNKADIVTNKLIDYLNDLAEQGLSFDFDDLDDGNRLKDFISYVRNSIERVDFVEDVLINKERTISMLNPISYIIKGFRILAAKTNL